MYLNVVRSAIGRDLKAGKKPDFSMKDWEFIYETMFCTERIIELYSNNEIYDPDISEAIYIYETETGRSIL